MIGSIVLGSPMPVALHRLAAFLLLCGAALAGDGATWAVAKSEHFEVYSQAGGSTARVALMWFEQLRAFFRSQTGFELAGRPPVRVIAFRSAKDYEPYRLRSAADAYYAGTESRDYIVMTLSAPGGFRVAAHEYAHLVLHAVGLQLPPWLGEGLAEVFSTVRLGEGVNQLSGKMPAHAQLLRRRAWMPLAQLLALPPESPVRADPDGAALFYAQSWALTEMLALSPDYGVGFPALIAALTSGLTGAQALTSVYAKSLDAITRDLHAWCGKRLPAPIPLAAAAPGSVAVEVSPVSPFVWRSRLAEVFLAAGDVARAESLYRDLAREAPENADCRAALGLIALRQGDRDGARREWKRAIDQHVADATLCYRYALLADSAGLPRDEIRTALERAVALQPDFDDARYTLALLEKNSGNYEAALALFRGLRAVASARAYSYWTAMADTLNELGRREEAHAAAVTARRYAATPDEHARAAQLAWVAESDVAVQFASGADGRPQLVTTRVPHQTPDFNPFIEPGDDIRRVQGAFRELVCAGTDARIVVDTAEGSLTLAIPDPLRVQMRNAPPELICGMQPAGAATVTVEYAVAQEAATRGIVRGMTFR